MKDKIILMFNIFILTLGTINAQSEPPQIQLDFIQINDQGEFEHFFSIVMTFISDKEIATTTFAREMETTISGYSKTMKEIDLLVQYASIVDLNWVIVKNNWSNNKYVYAPNSEKTFSDVYAGVVFFIQQTID